MDFSEFSKLIIEYRSLSRLPQALQYPKDITLPSYLWDKILTLYEFTRPYNYEHSITFFWADNDIVASPITKGSKEEVISKNQIGIKYVPKSRDLYEKQILFNGKLASRFTVKSSKLNSHSKIFPLCTIHTHPKQIVGDQEGYSFFSPKDISSLLRSKLLCIGLITDRLYFACKHSGTQPFLSDALTEELTSNSQYFFSSHLIPSKLISELKLVFYEGIFKKKLVRAS